MPSYTGGTDLLESYIVTIFITYEIEGSQKYWNVPKFRKNVLYLTNNYTTSLHLYDITFVQTVPYLKVKN